MKNIDENTIESIAEETHEALREMKQALGDDMPAWNDAEQWMRDSTVDMIKSIEENPNQTGKEVHDSWVKSKEDAGWKYGPEKNPELKTHPLMVPYEDLPFEEQFKDDLVRHSIDTGLQMAREGKYDAGELEDENKEFLKDHESELGIKGNNGPKGPGE